MTKERNFLERINSELEDGWEAKQRPDGRIYYINHKTQTSSWLPPRENWQENTGLPYGWETAIDGNNKLYYINHVDKYTTRDDPRQDPDYVEPPRPREVELVRDQEKGFGFVAGSEKPVIVRFVTEGGPSVDKLLPGDLILKINGEEVRRAPREKVIELVRSCRHSIVLTVSQPHCDNSSRKSAILTAAKKAKLKNNPSRVRFADAILVNGATVASQQSPQESYFPFMPNVLKVFLENGQTKSFKYDNKTTVKDVRHSLQEKLNITCTHHFSLVLQNMKSNVPGKMTLLQDHETLAELAARPAARHFRCLFRVAFVPHDAYDMLKEDPVAFEYFYTQCCNDVIQERFASEMKYDTALRLAALQIQQHAMTNNMTGKISIKAIEKDSGLDKFVPHSLLENMKSKDLRKMLAQYMKMNQNLTAPGQKQLSALQAKLHYMKIISELKTFGSRVFMVTLLDQKSEAMILVGPKAGVSVVTNIKSYTLTQLADFNQIENIKITREGENMHRVDISTKINNKQDTIGLGLLIEDAENFVSMVVGYYHIFVDRDKRIVDKTIGKNVLDPNIPLYDAEHRVVPSSWAYPEDLLSDDVEMDRDESGSENERIIDLSKNVPDYERNEEYIAKIKQDLDLKTTPAVFENPAFTDVITPPGRMSNGQIFEEGVTSFGRATIIGEDSSSQDSSMSSHGTSFNIVANLTSFSRSDAIKDHVNSNSTRDLQPQITLITFSSNSDNSSVQSAYSHKPTLQESVSGDAAFMNQTSSLETNYTHGLNCYVNPSLGHDQNDRSDTTSSTSSLSTNEVSERQALLGDKQFREESPTRFSNLKLAGANMNDAMDADSDDVDSLGTPHSSPAKTKQPYRNASLDLALQQSFGLHSPVTVLPGADVDFQDLDESIQFTTNGTVEAYNSVYSSQGYAGQTLYYDPDIIDLTNFPPPATPDDDSILDFTEPNYPPPIFSSNSSLASYTKNDTAWPPALPPRSSSIPSRLERSASTGNCPDFLDDDIDALIAQFTIPPPPTMSDTSTTTTDTANNNSTATKVTSNSRSRDTPSDISEDLAHLIIPPPPTSLSNKGDNIPVVPPVPTSLSSKKKERKHAERNNFQHKRSSSLDINFLQRSKDQFDSKFRSVSMDDNKSVKDSASTFDPTSNISGVMSISGEISAESTHDVTRESPASVSEKLHSLLLSLPSFAHEVNQVGDKHVPKSHHHHRSSSLDLTSTRTQTQFTTANVSGKSDPNSIPIFLRSSSLKLKWPPSRPRSHSCEPASRSPPSEISDKNTTKSTSTKEVDKSPVSSESFASMKAKLKEYRDFLLNKSKSSASKKIAIESDNKQTSDLETVLPQRSGSFSKLLAHLRGSKSEEHESVTLISTDANWELKEAKPNVQPSLNGKPTLEQGGDKRVPIVRDVLGLNRPTLRPVSNSLNQIEIRKNGPIKAVQPAIVGGGNTRAMHFNTISHEPSRYYHRSRISKDDNLMTHGQKKEKMKANPYATIKMWRPTSTENSIINDASAEDFYQSFTKLNTFQSTDSSQHFRTESQPPLNASRNIVIKPDRNKSHINSHTDISDYKKDKETDPLYVNGYKEIPEDYSTDSKITSLFRKVNIRNEWTFDSSELSNEMLSNVSPPPPPQLVFPLSSIVNSSSQTASLNSSLTLPTPSSSISSLKDQQNGLSNVSPPPPLVFPSSSIVHSSSQTTSLNSSLTLPTPPSTISSLKDQQNSLSYNIVSDGTTNSVKLVLSHTYTSIELVNMDLERLLAELKLTMESLKISQSQKNTDQNAISLSELQLQTKQFIQEAKLVVSSANNNHDKMIHHLESAVHTLAYVFLHGQATMLLMKSTDQALQLANHMINVATSFKATISATNLALGKTLNDPNMKYLMRQAQNLATLLATLVNIIKEVELK